MKWFRRFSEGPFSDWRLNAEINAILGEYRDLKLYSILIEEWKEPKNNDKIILKDVCQDSVCRLRIELDSAGSESKV
jgi:hypothetical protein